MSFMIEIGLTKRVFLLKLVLGQITDIKLIIVITKQIMFAMNKHAVLENTVRFFYIKEKAEIKGRQLPWFIYIYILF